MSIAPGTRLGSYDVVGPLGSGGMGEVYRARDSRLNRDIALKILPSTLSQDVEYTARFKREAQVLASLNHPHIAQIYGLEDDAIIMELVEGRTLAEYVAETRGPLPLDETIAIARQIAEALEAAHEKGIIHRDLKPANVKVTPEGTVKVLDFGLARVTDRASVFGDPINSPTMTIQSTQAGLILGTAAYMSPEQAAGKSVDRRADIWSFGVVLWEMLTGTQLFVGETISHILADVLRANIDATRFPAGTPPVIRELVMRCLDRDMRARLQWIGEARIALERYAAHPTVSVNVLAPRASWPLWTLGSATILALVSAGIVWFNTSRRKPIRPLIRLEAQIAQEASLARSNGGAMLALSPDGTRLALTLRGADGIVRLNTRLLNQTELTALPGTENAASPFFSPDSKWIAFSADGRLKRVSAEGGGVRTICDAPREVGASWGDDGNIIVALSPTSGLSRVAASGGVPIPITKLEASERTHRYPFVLPGSKAVLFISSMGAGNYNDARIDVVSLQTGKRSTVQRGGFSPRFLVSPSGAGYLVYLNQTTLFAVPFDPATLETTGSPIPVLEEVGSNARNGGDFAFTQDGTFVYVRGKYRSNWAISWLDSSGNTKPLHDVPGIYDNPRFSPDGKSLAFTMRNDQGSDIWVKDLDRDIHTRITSSVGLNHGPVWTPDGKSIIFSCGHASGLCSVRSDGSSSPHRFSQTRGDLFPHSLTLTGLRIALTGVPSPPVAGIGRAIYTASLEGSHGRFKVGNPEPFVESRFDASSPVFSPDGRWLAYSSRENGAPEVYVKAFPGPGGRWQISNGGGAYPVWSRNSRELFFTNNHIMAANYSVDGESFVPGKARIWSPVRLLGTGSNNFDIAPDGKRVAAILANDLENEPNRTTQLTFLVNFVDEIERRASKRD